MRQQKGLSHLNMYQHEDRAALAQLAREHTASTNADLVKSLGVARPESVPNLTRRFAAWFGTKRDERTRLKQLEAALNASELPE